MLVEGALGREEEEGEEGGLRLAGGVPGLDPWEGAGDVDGLFEVDDRVVAAGEEDVRYPPVGRYVSNGAAVSRHGAREDA